MIKDLLYKIRIHPLFWLMLAAGIITGHFREVIIVFMIVFVHEMGHAVAAHFFGWRIRKIELLPFGGVAETDEHGNRSLIEESIIVLAGPFQHVLIFLVAFILYQSSLLSTGDYELLLRHNGVILLFNMLPLWPLDGGKLLKIICSYFFSYKKALSVSLLLSAVFLLCFSIGCVLYYPFHLNLWGVTLFLWVVHYKEWRQQPYVYMRFLMGRYYQLEKPILKLKPLVVSSEDTIFEVFTYFHKGFFHTIEVKNKYDQRSAVLEESRLLRAFFEEKKASDPVGQLFL